jgi:signal transduction histidine kinase
VLEQASAGLDPLPTEIRFIRPDDIELDLGELPRVTANAGELNQVFLNLIVNAAHAIAARVAHTDERGTIILHTRADDGAVTISVSDTGCGIAPDIAGRVFDPFFTTKEVGRGTGQGLAIAQTIVVRAPPRNDQLRAGARRRDDVYDRAPTRRRVRWPGQH